MQDEAFQVFNEFIQAEYSLQCLFDCLCVLEQNEVDGQMVIRLSKEILKNNIKKIRNASNKLDQIIVFNHN